MIDRVTRRAVIENIVTLLSARTMAQIVVSLVLLLSARALGANRTGQYIACFALTKLTSIVFELGMDAWLLKEGGTRPSDVANLISNILLVKLTIGIPWFIGVWLLRPILNEQTYPTDLLMIAAMATWIESILQSFLTGFTATLMNRKTATLSILSSLVLLGSTATLIANGIDIPISYAYVRLFVGVIMVLIAYIWVSREERVRLAATSIKSTIQAARHYFASDALSIIYTQSGITIVALLMGNHGAGIYGPAIRVIFFLYLVPFSVFRVMVPVLSRLHHESDSRFGNVIRQLLIGMILVGGLLWMIVGIFGRTGLELLLGAGFKESGILLATLGVILFLRATSFSTASILVAANLQKQRLPVQGISATIHLILAFILIPEIGLSGAAAAFISSEIALMAGYSILTFRWISKYEFSSA